MAEQVAASSHLMCAISEPLKIRTTNSLLDWQLAQIFLLLFLLFLLLLLTIALTNMPNISFAYE